MNVIKLCWKGSAVMRLMQNTHKPYTVFDLNFIHGF